MEANYQIMSDGVSLAIYKWLPKTKPIAFIHIVHGMAEHALRYTEFAEEACKLGFGVYASDHRGHGKTAATGIPNSTDKGLLGFLAEKDGFFRVVEDQKEINSEIQKHYPNIPIIIFGHSFGSFITQRYIEQYSDTVSACILSGSSGPNPIVGIGTVLANLVTVFTGRKKYSKLLNALSFGSYNKGVKNPKTNFDWLSRDENEVKKYIEDELCGFICTSGFYQDLMKGLKTIHRKSEIAKISNNLPILIASGDRDPVSSYGKTVKALCQIYKNKGIKSVELKLYNGARHELLNEINKAEVKADIFNWIKKILKT